MVAASVRQFFKFRELTDAEIDARLAAAPSPLEAAQLCLLNVHGPHQQEFRVTPAAVPHSVPGLGIQIVTVDENPPQKPIGPIDFAAMTAKLQAAGVQMEGEAPPPPSGHGLSVGEPTATAGARKIL